MTLKLYENGELSVTEELCGIVIFADFGTGPISIANFFDDGNTPCKTYALKNGREVILRMASHPFYEKLYEEFQQFKGLCYLEISKDELTLEITV